MFKDIENEVSERNFYIKDFLVWWHQKSQKSSVPVKAILRKSMVKNKKILSNPEVL